MKIAPASLRPTHVVFAAVLLIRLFSLGQLAGSAALLPSGGDMSFYHDWAQRILHGEWTDHHAFYGLPLYAYWLAALYRIFGTTPFVPAFIQSAADAGTAVLLYKIAALAFREANTQCPTPTRWWHFQPAELIGLAAAAGWALFVPAQTYAIVLMPTSLFVFVFWYVVWQIVRRPEAPTSRAYFLLGTLLGATAMAVATILSLLVLLAAAIWLKWRPRERRLRTALTASALLLSGTIVGTAPCWLHNALVARDPVFLSAHDGVNLWIGNNPEATGYPHFPEMHAGQAAMLRDSISLAETAAGRSLRRSETSAYWSRRAHDYIREHPAAWLKLLARKIANFWNAWQYDDLGVIARFRQQGITLPGIYFGLVAALALPGICLAMPTFAQSRWICGAIGLQMLTLLPVFVTERYRIAAVPGLLLFAGFFVWRLWLDCSRFNARSIPLDVGLLGAATLLASVPRNDPALWALDFYNAGWQALEAKDLPLAQEKLDRAYAYVPENAEINLALGNLAMERGDTATAERYYVDAIQIDPNHRSALSNLAVIALDEHQPQRAADLLRAAMKSGLSEAKTHYLLALAEYQLGHSDLALSEINAAVRLNPTQHEFVELRDQIRAGRGESRD